VEHNTNITTDNKISRPVVLFLYHVGKITVAIIVSVNWQGFSAIHMGFGDIQI
jgi:hypothetical protein